MDLTSRICRLDWSSSEEKRADFKRRTEAMNKIMKKGESEISKVVHKVMEHLEDEHKRLFTKEERGLVDIPDFVGFLTWPDHECSTIRTSFYCSPGMEEIVQATRMDFDAHHRSHCARLRDGDERYAFDRAIRDDLKVLDLLIKRKKNEERERMKEELRSSESIQGQTLSKNEINLRVRQKFHQHRCKKECSPDCEMCIHARQACSWHPDIPYICMSNLSKTEKTLLIKHFQIKEKELWMEIRGAPCDDDKEEAQAEELQPVHGESRVAIEEMDEQDIIDELIMEENGYNGNSRRGNTVLDDQGVSQSHENPRLGSRDTDFNLTRQDEDGIRTEYNENGLQCEISSNPPESMRMQRGESDPPGSADQAQSDEVADRGIMERQRRSKRPKTNRNFGDMWETNV